MSVHKIIHEFDPFGWIERVVPAKWLYRIINACMLLIVLGFLAARIQQYDSFAFKPLWVTETFLFIVLAIAFGIRREPIDRSRGFVEIVIPLIGSALPFGLLFTQPSVWIVESDVLLNAVFFWMTLATGFTAWSMWVLRRSFSITVEARELVTSGPYQWVRHPVYLGEILAAAAVVVWRWSLVNAGLFILFVAIQMLRARREENKLTRAFAEYRGFAGKSWWVERRVVTTQRLNYLQCFSDFIKKGANFKKMDTLIRIMALRLFRMVLGMCLMLLLVTERGYAMQPPPPPLNAAQLKILLSDADVVVVGKISAVRETDNSIEVALKVEKRLKGRLASKTIQIKEMYKRVQAPNRDSKNNEIVGMVAGPSSYHGSYKKGSRIVVLLKKIEGSKSYMPLGSGTYDKHLCEFIIEKHKIRTLNFKFADDVEQHAGQEKDFIGFIKKIMEAD